MENKNNGIEQKAESAKGDMMRARHNRECLLSIGGELVDINYDIMKKDYPPIMSAVARGSEVVFQPTPTKIQGVKITDTDILPPHDSEWLGSLILIHTNRSGELSVTRYSLGDKPIVGPAKDFYLSNNILSRPKLSLIFQMKRDLYNDFIAKSSVMYLSSPITGKILFESVDGDDVLPPFEIRMFSATKNGENYYTVNMGEFMSLFHDDDEILVEDHVYSVEPISCSICVSRLLDSRPLKDYNLESISRVDFPSLKELNS